MLKAAHHGMVQIHLRINVKQIHQSGKGYKLLS